MRTARAACGLTLVEGAIVLALLAIVASAAAPSFAGFLEARRVSGIADQLALDLREARAEALRRGNAMRVSVQGGAWGSCYVVHTGALGQCSCAGGGAAACAGDARASRTVHLPARLGIVVQANVASIRFEPLHGVATPAGTVKVVAPASGRAVHEVVNIAGRVRSCTPAVGAPAVPGHRPC